jgi:hypothetical protein
MMNYLICLLVTISLSLSSVLVIPFTEIETAFQSADSAKIMELSKSKLLINLDGKEGVYSQPQGNQVLKTFFKTNPPKSFVYSFKGTEKKLGSYAIGIYSSTNSSTFKVSLKFLKEGEMYKIESLTINKE